MYHAEGRLVIRRRLAYDVGVLQAELSELPPQTRIAVHLREATSGDRGECNLHPHVARFDETGLELAVMHNGSFRRLPVHAHSGPSDTAVFVSKWLPRRIGQAPAQWHAKEHLEAMAAFAGERNRLVLLDTHGTWRVLGTHEGFEVGGTWLSNPKAKAWL